MTLRRSPPAISESIRVRNVELILGHNRAAGPGGEERRQRGRGVKLRIAGS